MRFTAAACAVLLLGQVGSAEAPESNPDYRGQLVFTRIRYGASADAFAYFGGRSTWSHDYPRADLHLSRLLSELTNIDANVSSTNVFTLDDPELFRHPIAYISEPGFWTLSDEDAENLRSYLLKGGFLIFDDFEHEQWLNFEAQMMRVVPDHRLVELDVSHPIFHSFFEMRTIDFPHPLVNVMPTYFGIFEDNDPEKRLMVIVNYNNDVAEYWEWSDSGWFPIEITNEAYKLGVNYMVYALTH
jgi:hypothetical protein